LLPVSPIRRPDLRGDVCSLIGLVCHGHVDGALQLPIGQLVRTFGVPVAPDFHAQLDDRGDLHFAENVFHNHGPLIRRDVRLFGIGGELEIASPLRGTLDRGFDRFALDFEPGASFRVGRFLFEAELARLDINDQRVLASFRPGFELAVELTGELPAVGEA
jgi:hypothetical protein